MLQPVPQCSCRAIDKCKCNVSNLINGLIESNKPVQFLMGLNESYDPIRSQILVLDPLPTVNKAYSMTLRIEKQRAI